MKDPKERNDIILQIKEAINATNFLCEIEDYPERYKLDSWSNDRVCILYIYTDCMGNNIAKLYYKLDSRLPVLLINEL